MPPISLARARQLYEGPPRRTLADVARELGCCEGTLSSRFRRVGIVIRPRFEKAVAVPAGVGPLFAEVLRAVLDSGLSWGEIEAEADAGHDTVRLWFHRPPVNPPMSIVERVAAAVGYRLALVPLEPEPDGD